MCGFAGFTHSHLSLDKVDVIRSMIDTIVHRGPDSGGIHTDQDITLGFRRLKIIDMSEDGSQPMYNESNSCVLVFNGEIYNYKQLRAELIKEGHIFTSNTDSEVIVHGYEQYGIHLLQKLRGMFAFAIWDITTSTLLLARDFFGIKPLYYTQNTADGSLLFGSEIKTLLKHPYFQKQFNNEALKPYLTFQYSALDETFFKGVYKLKPGHYLVYKDGKIQQTRYWKPSFEPIENTPDFYVEQVHTIMQQSVQYHKTSDVKVGAFLSGGVDSSYITALLKPSKTFSIGFKHYENQFNETDLAKQLSAELGIQHYSRLITADECFDLLPTIQYHMDEPQSNPSAVPLYFLAQLAREHVTVVLSGEGADEIFAGYDTYDRTPAMRMYEHIPLPLRRSISFAASKLPRHRITSFLKKGGLTAEQRFIGQAEVFSLEDAHAILKHPYQSGPSAWDVTKHVYAQMPAHQDELTKMQLLDLQLWLPGDILLKADKMSLAHSIELRVPFLDQKVMELASKLPSPLRVQPGHTKNTLRRAAQKVVPEQWANRPKVGFPVPIRYWLREEKYYERVKAMFLCDVATIFFNTELLVYYLDAHYTGKKNYARYIWTVYVFLTWYMTFFEESTV